MRHNHFPEPSASYVDDVSRHASIGQIGVGVAALGVIVASTTVAGALVGVAVIGCALGIVLFSSIVLAALMI